MERVLRVGKIIIDKIKDLFYILINELMKQNYIGQRFTGKIIVNMLNGKINEVEKRDNLKF